MCHIMYILRPSALKHNFKYNRHPEKLCTTKIYNYPIVVIIVFHFIECTLKYNVQRLGKPTKNNLMFCCHDTNFKVSKEDIEGSNQW